MDKFPGDAAKIIDQSESFLLGGTFQSCKNMNCKIINVAKASFPIN